MTSQCDMYNSIEYVLYFDYPYWIPPFVNLTLAANLCHFIIGGFFGTLGNATATLFFPALLGD